MTAHKEAENPEFLYLLLENILVEEQVRSGIDTESEPFKALMESIKNRGILEPVLVTPKDGKYLLLCGERRYLAASKLYLESIPARIVNTVIEKDEILAYQLIENLQREELNPIDQAKGILAYIQAKHPDKNYNADEAMNDLMKVQLRPESLLDETVFTLNTVAQISAKSYPTLFRTISLLKLSPEIQAAIRAGNLSVSQGYLFAANLECPDLMKIFTGILKIPVTYITLEKMLSAYKTVKQDSNNSKPVSVKKQVKSLLSIKTVFEKGLGTYVREDVDKFLHELEVFCDYVQQQAPKIPYGRKRPPQV